MKRTDRVQRRRTRGWSAPEGSVIVDRSSRWGNPFKFEDILAAGAASTAGEARAVAVHRFGRWLDGDGPDEYEIRGNRTVSRTWVQEHLEELVGKVLVARVYQPASSSVADPLEAAVMIRELWQQHVVAVDSGLVGVTMVPPVDPDRWLYAVRRTPWIVATSNAPAGLLPPD